MNWQVGDEIRKDAEPPQYATRAIVRFPEHPCADSEERRDAGGCVIEVVECGAALGDFEYLQKVRGTMRTRTPNPAIALRTSESGDALQPSLTACRWLRR